MLLLGSLRTFYPRMVFRDMAQFRRKVAWNVPKIGRRECASRNTSWGAKFPRRLPLFMVFTQAPFCQHCIHSAGISGILWNFSCSTQSNNSCSVACFLVIPLFPIVQVHLITSLKDSWILLNGDPIVSEIATDFSVLEPKAIKNIPSIKLSNFSHRKPVGFQQNVENDSWSTFSSCAAKKNAPLFWKADSFTELYEISFMHLSVLEPETWNQSKHSIPHF